MFNRLLNIPRYLNLTKIGIVELIFSLTLFLSGFRLSNIPMTIIAWGILILIVFFRERKINIWDFKPLSIFIIYWIIHELFIILVDNLNANLNLYVEQSILFISFYFLYPSLNLEKLRGSLNWVSLISIAGLLYQWGIITSGGGVHPLEIPGLSMSDYRLETLTFRPSSFFMEPAAYVAFMICPLALALIDKKYSWAIILILSMFLTTSTTGFVLSFIMLGMSLLSKRLNRASALALIIIGLGLYYALTHFDAFERGVEKYENTEIETTVRLSQGPRIVSSMEPYEYFFGVPYCSVYSYCKDRNVKGVIYYGKYVYMSSFWMLLLRFGFAGLILYFYIYYKIIRTSRLTIPLTTCLFAVMFSSSYTIGSTFIFTLLFLLTICKYEDNILPDLYEEY